MTTKPYHHGDLRRELLVAAAIAIEESGPGALSLRELARRAGVSHAAPAHHFGDKTGLLTALAAQGWELLGEALAGASDDLLEAGVAYVRFAVGHRAHFEVMFRPDVLRREDPSLLAAQRQARARLRAALGSLPRPPTGERAELASLAAWSSVHGFATLWAANMLPRELGGDPAAAARDVIRRLF